MLEDIYNNEEFNKLCSNIRNDLIKVFKKEGYPVNKIFNINNDFFVSEDKNA